MATPRKAVVLIHGMGNQYPLTSIRNFVEGMEPDGKTLFSSPDRIIGDLESRRFSHKGTNIDYFEFYWAHLMKSPSFMTVMWWVFKLIFIKRPSERAKPAVYTIRGFFIIIIGLYFCCQHFFSDYFQGWNHFTSVNVGGVFPTILTLTTLLVLIIAILILFSRLISIKITQSLGDVVNYTTPAPTNIDVRNSIRKKGIELIEKLHQAKDSNGELKYSGIIIIGHSLGSIIAYDLLTFMFPKYHYNLKMDLPEKQIELEWFLKKYYSGNGDVSWENYQEDQDKLSLSAGENSKFWRIKDFITLGSPLTHSHMVIAKNKSEFERRVQIREFPVCPPVQDIEDQFKIFYSPSQNGQYIPHHAALFAFTRWTNIFFRNDLIGGSIPYMFGNGVKDIELRSQVSVLSRILPFWSHCNYWETSEINSCEIIRNILNRN